MEETVDFPSTPKKSVDRNNKEVIDMPPEISISSINQDLSNQNEQALGFPRPADEYQLPPIAEGDEQIHEEESKECFIPVLQETEHYLERRRINDFLKFMLNHLLANEPDDPVEFLTQLLDKCLMFRSGILASAPVIFEDRHIQSLYKAFDPLAMGSISVKQYCVGMSTLGLADKEFDKHPDLLQDGTVPKETFIKNAKLALVEKLMDMIVLPPPYSDGETSSIEMFLH